MPKINISATTYTQFQTFIWKVDRNCTNFKFSRPLEPQLTNWRDPNLFSKYKATLQSSKRDSLKASHLVSKYSSHFPMQMLRYSDCSEIALENLFLSTDVKLIARILIYPHALLSFYKIFFNRALLAPGWFSLKLVIWIHKLKCWLLVRHLNCRQHKIFAQISSIIAVYLKKTELRFSFLGNGKLRHCLQISNATEFWNITE